MINCWYDAVQMISCWWKALRKICFWCETCIMQSCWFDAVLMISYWCEAVLIKSCCVRLFLSFFEIYSHKVEKKYVQCIYKNKREGSREVHGWPWE
jgi:hypothetical protein